MPDQVAPLLAVTGAAVVDAFGLEEANVVLRFEAAREDRNRQRLPCAEVVQVLLVTLVG